jgi:membrane-associated phospholipid phosphatase
VIFDYDNFVTKKLWQLLSYIVFIAAVMGNVSESAGQNKYELSFKTEIPILTAGIGLSAIGLYLMKNTKPLEQKRIDELNCENINDFDRVACTKYSPEMDKWSDFGLTASVLLPVSLAFSSKVRSEFSNFGLLYFENLMLTSAGVTISKGIFRRIRPMTYNDDVPYKRKIDNTDLRHSFYSGHTAIAFSSVVFFAAVYDRYYRHSKWRPYVWGGSLALGSSVGILRILAGKHFPTDVIVGAIMGGVTGYLVPLVHKKNDPKKDDKQFIVRFAFTF